MPVYLIEKENGGTEEINVPGSGCFTESRIVGSGEKIIAIDGKAFEF